MTRRSVLLFAVLVAGAAADLGLYLVALRLQSAPLILTAALVEVAVCFYGVGLVMLGDALLHPEFWRTQRDIRELRTARRGEVRG